MMSRVRPLESADISVEWRLEPAVESGPREVKLANGPAAQPG